MQQQDVFERARQSRDARFDGRFFVGVRTTGIYCRPICPAVTPKRENVEFYPTAAAAGEAGYRPCLRCRPECAPGTPAWNGTSTTVRRGLRLIAAGALDEGSIENLAERLGVTSRHLRRLFTRHLGASPLAVAHTQRLHLAKRLIDETDLPLSEVAVAAGFGSVRRFNDAFRNSYGRAPRDLRRRSVASVTQAGALTVRLPWREPYDWRGVLDFLAGRATPGVEQVTASSYWRTLRIGDSAAILECRCDADRSELCVTLHGVATLSLLPIIQRVRDLFDLDAPIADITAVLGGDPVLGPLLKRRPGVRVPGAWDTAELTVRAILGQQVSVRAATTLAGRIADRYGDHVELPAGLRDAGLQLSRLFPEPAKLARARFNGIGLVTARAATIRAVSGLFAATDIEDAAEAATLRQELLAIRGIGDWTAQYVAMRGQKDPNAFPVTDLGLLKAAGCPAAELRERADLWRPWRAYAAMLLWGSLANAGG